MTNRVPRLDSDGDDVIDQSSSHGIGGVTDNVRNAADYSGSDGGTQIQNAIDDIGTAPGVVFVPSNGPDDVSASTNSIGISAYEQNAWEVSSPISVPSNTTILFCNSYVYLSDSTNDNILTNNDFAGGNAHIALIGIGRPILDGNDTNQTQFSRTSSDARKNHGLRLVHIDDLEIRSLSVRNTNAWGIYAGNIEDGIVRGLRFDQSGNSINQDGIHLEGPLTDVTVSQIVGETEDDTVVIDAEESEDLSQAGGDVESVSVSNVHSSVNDAGETVKIAGEEGTGTYELRSVVVSNITSHGTGSECGVSVQDADTDADNVRGVQISNVATDGMPAVRLENQNKGVSLTNCYSQNAPAVVSIDGRNFYLALNNISGFDCDTVVHATGSTEGSPAMDSSSFTNIRASREDTNACDVVSVDSSVAANGVSFMNVHSDVRGGGAVFNLNSDMSNCSFYNIHVREADEVFAGSGAVTGWANNIRTVTINNTIYGTLFDGLSFGRLVPPLASGSWTITGGSGTGVKTNEVTNVTGDQTRQLRVDQWVSSGPAATYAVRPIADFGDEWDNGNSRRDVTLRANLTTDPGASNDITMSYEITPGNA